jgi:drug/metabolite transporter (DMT)-like permease
MLKGVALKIGATLAFALMYALIKLAAPTFPVAEIVFFRSIFAMATLALWLASRGEWPSALRTTRPLGHIGRSLAGSCGIFGNFLALAFLPLADATAFTFVTPLMVVPLASIVLGEAVSPMRAGAVAAGFLGVVVMLWGQFGAGPAGSGSGIGVTAALIGAGAGAVAMIQTRRLTQSEATGAIVFYFSSVTAVVSLAVLAAAFLWPAGGALSAVAASQRFVAPGPLAFAGLAAIGLLGGCGQILMTHCYRFAHASVIASFDYLAMIWAAALGYLLFAEIPSASVLGGAAIVIAAGGALIAWEHGAGLLWRLAALKARRAPTESFDSPDAFR